MASWGGGTSPRFNSRSPSGERPTVIYNDFDAFRVSTHAPRVGSDARFLRSRDTSQCFNSRSPSGERRKKRSTRIYADGFNSRSPSGERPCTRPSRLPTNIRFNSRSPSGERHYRWRLYAHHRVSTHAPRVGSDGTFTYTILLPYVSTHAPRVGSDISFHRLVFLT